MARSLGLSRTRRLQRGLGDNGLATAPAWTPAQLTALRGWYRADDLIVSGSDVTQWTDKSGIGNHLTDGGSAARRPLLVSSDAAFGGRPVVEFDGTAEWLSCTFSWGAAAGPLTLLYVMRLVTNVNGRQLLAYFGSNLLIAQVTTGRITSRVIGTMTTSATDLGNARRVATIYTGSTHSLRVGGTVESGPTAQAGTIADGSTLSLGGGMTGLNLSNARFAELVLMRSEITAGELSSWDSYVSSRYGL